MPALQVRYPALVRQAIERHIVASMGGKVEAEAIRLRGEATNTRVLVIDDDSSMLQLIHSLLQTASYDCLVASSGEEALARLRSTSDVLVAISDINMPGMDGIAFLESLGSQSAFVSVPRVIFLTAHAHLDHAVAALRLGAVDFLSKPVRSQELLSAVRSAVERVHREREAASLPAHAAMLARQAEALADALKNWSAPSTQDENTAHAPARQPVDLALLGLDHLRPPRRSSAPLGELDDIAWDLLLQLLRADKQGRRFSVSALSISVEHVSPTTALRRIHELVKAGHVVRHPDPMDARREFLVLASESRVALERYLQQVTKELAAAAASTRN